MKNSIKYLLHIYKIMLYVFAAIGLFFSLGYLAIHLGITNETGIIIDNQRDRFLQPVGVALTDQNTAWSNSTEWLVLKEAIIKDIPVINLAAKNSGIPPRIIVAQLTVEQLRLFHTNRTIFKEIFEPLKILGNQSQFSWGIMGIKKETAVKIEEHLKDDRSQYYLGESFANILDFKTTDHNKERFERIVNENDHYYSYLYCALYIKQIINQWKNAGYDIENRPEILSTLYNIGFANSHPKPDPQIGGSEIEIDGQTYNFGSLAGEFYNSNELIDIFPR